MKTLPEPNDPLLQSLIEEASTLPQTAAAHARQARRSQANRLRAAALLAMLLLAAAIWFPQHPPNRTDTDRIAVTVNPAKLAGIPTGKGYVKVYPASEAATADLNLSGASEPEKKLFAELPGIPVLVVKDKVGHVARIHIFDR